MLLKKATIVGLVASALLVTACTEKRPTESTKRVDTGSITRDKSLSSTQKAEKLALAAEQLMTPASFMYADEVAATALAYDANNKRAQLLRALLGPAMASEGILERVKPIATRSQETAADYKKMLEDVSKYPNSAIKTFLLEGATQDIKDEASAQAFMSVIQSRYDDLRTWFKANKGLEITLHLPDTFQQSVLKKNSQNCEAFNPETGVFEVTCDFSNIFEVKANKADFEAAQQIVAGMQIYSIMLNSYDLSGLIKFADDNKGRTTIPGKDVVNQLLANKSFGKLRDQKGMQSILALGLDGIAGVRWAQGLQQELCPNGSEAKVNGVSTGVEGQTTGGTSNRPGYVFREGICVDQDGKSTGDDVTDPQWKTVGAVLKTAELALRGGLINATFTGRNNSIDTQIKASAIFAKPVQDVRKLTPLKWDRCDRIVGTADNTLGGLFVNGDANAVLGLNSNACEN